MPMESERLNCSGSYSGINCSDHNIYGKEEVKEEVDHLPLTSNGDSQTTSSSSSALGFIHHPVSKLDTLAGVAIKYGVEVADVKKVNGLITDLQMFAHKSLQIPLPGRHPPSPSFDTSRDINPQQGHSNIFDSFQSLKLNCSERKVSPAMSYLQGYYRLASGTEELHRKGDSLYLEDVQCVKPNTPLSYHRKTRSLVNCFVDETREDEKEKGNETLVRRRQKSEADFSSSYPEMLIKEDNSDKVGLSSSTIRGKGSKAGTRDTSCGMEDSIQNGGYSGVRKSSSTSNLHDQDNSTSSIWSTSKWILKPDLQAFSPASIARPIFDGLPKPTTTRKNKAALD